MQPLSPHVTAGPPFSYVFNRRLSKDVGETWQETFSRGVCNGALCLEHGSCLVAALRP